MSNIIKKTEDFATTLLRKDLSPNYRYHNLKHTQRVVKSTQELLNASQLEQSVKEATILAAWLHDTGYTVGNNNHEEESCKIAKEFLTDQQYDARHLQLVLDTIMATKMYNVPKTEPEKILKDADASHFAKKSYPEIAELLREELSLLGVATYTPDEWIDENIKIFTEDHVYYTDYAQEHWGPKKDKNLKRLLRQKKFEIKVEQREALKAKYKEESPERGIQTLFRVALKNHMTLSNIADTKANILLSVNSIIISLVLSNLIPKLDNPTNTYLIYPTIIFTVFSVVSVILAVLATRPNITSGAFTKEDVALQKVNLLFFGNFHKMDLEEYEWAISQMQQDKEYIYKMLTKDLYYLGLVLNRKYTLLRWTYTIFMIGLVLSVIAFALAFRYNAQL